MLRVVLLTATQLLVGDDIPVSYCIHRPRESGAEYGFLALFHANDEMVWGDWGRNRVYWNDTERESLLGTQSIKGGPGRRLGLRTNFVPDNLHVAQNARPYNTLGFARLCLGFKV